MSGRTKAAVQDALTGATGAGALAITGRLADGWIPGYGSDWLSDLYRWSRPLIDKAAVDVGRDPAEVITVFNFDGVLADRDLEATRDSDGRWLGGSAQQWINELAGAVRDYGAGGFNTNVTNAAGQLDLDTARRFADEVIPAVRAALV